MMEKRTKSGLSDAVRTYHHSVDSLASERVNLRHINEKLESMLPKRDARREDEGEEEIPIDVVFED